MTNPPDKSLSVRELAAYWRVSTRKIRALVKRGLLQAIDLGTVGRTQLRITPSAIAECERRLAVRAAAPRRRRETIDPEIARLLDC